MTNNFLMRSGFSANAESAERNQLLPSSPLGMIDRGDIEPLFLLQSAGFMSVNSCGRFHAYTFSLYVCINAGALSDLRKWPSQSNELGAAGKSRSTKWTPESSIERQFSGPLLSRSRLVEQFRWISIVISSVELSSGDFKVSIVALLFASALLEMKLEKSPSVSSVFFASSLSFCYFFLLFFSRTGYSLAELIRSITLASPS